MSRATAALVYLAAVVVAAVALSHLPPGRAAPVLALMAVLVVLWQREGRRR